jgi:hypothetical protein
MNPEPALEVVLFCDYRADAMLIIDVDGMHEVYPPRDYEGVRDHPMPKDKGLGHLGMAQGLGKGRGEEPDPSFQEIDEGAVLHLLEAEQPYKAVACFQFIIVLF